MTPAKPRPEEQEQSWQTLYLGMSALSNTLDPRRVLETTLDASAALLLDQEGLPGGLVMAVMLYPEDPAESRTLRAGVLRGFAAEERAVELSGTGGLIGQTLQKKKPQLANLIEDDPELSRFASLRTCKEAYCVPLGKSNLEGVLLYGHPQGGFFSADRRRFLELLAGQASLALHNARRFCELQSKIEQLLDLQELNKVELARELHDGPTQSVAALAMRVNIARRLAAREAPNLVEELAKIESIARQATSELRQLLFKIHPQLLESQGLAQALQELGKRTGQVHDIGVRVRVEPEVQAVLGMARQAVIFNLVEQALRVICRKEGLENIWINLVTGNLGQAVLEIEDDGLVESGSGLGTTDATSTWPDGIHQQVILLGGILEPISAGDHGTSLRITIPLDGESETPSPGKA